MRKDYRKNKLFNRRSLILTSIRAFLSTVLIARLGFLQLKKHEEYSTRSDKNRIKTIIQPALRGIIFDRNNKVLVYNRKNYRLLLYITNKSNIKNTITKLVTILDLDEQNKKGLLKKAQNSRKKSIISLIDNLSWNDLAKVEVNSYRLPELYVESIPVRYYPFPFETAHIVGYVSLPSEREIKNTKNQALFLNPNFRVGKSGIEKSFDKHLRGGYGVRYSEVNAFGAPVRKISEASSSDGKNLNLTLNLELQRFIYDKILNYTASVVVMDVKSGEILALNSSPSFDVNNFVEGFSSDYWNNLLKNKGRPLNNKPLTANYPPGSVFKLIVALAALEENIDENKKIKCNGKHRFGRRTFHCWKKNGHGSLGMQEAIKGSCNIYFYNIAYEIGIDKITTMAAKMGYGQDFDIDLQEVSSPKLPSDTWKRKVLKEQWVAGDTLNASIGQGFILASPLQMAVATSRIANGGVAIKPYIVKDINSYNQFNQLKDQKIVDLKHLKFIQKAMGRVVNESGGTAYRSRIKDKNFKMAGKTGTSQVISKREIEMKEGKIDKNKDHAIFTAFAPIDNPKYSICVVVENGGSGSGVAAPLAKIIFEEVKKLET